MFRQFFANEEGGRALLRNVDLNTASQVVFDYHVFVNSLSPNLSSFEDVMRENAETALSCMGLALCSMRNSNTMHATTADILTLRSRPIEPRFVNFRPLTMLSRLKADLIGKFVSVRGNVVKVQGVRPLVKRMDFECARCGQIISKDLVCAFSKRRRKKLTT